MNKKRILRLSFGFILVVISIWQIYVAQAGLDIIYLKTSNPPVTIITPSNTIQASRPTVLIAHGFAGSSVLMRGFALTLAHAGYTLYHGIFRVTGQTLTH
jgi:pimeloyl-ACP methyl ester carboxylesterase